MKTIALQSKMLHGCLELLPGLHTSLILVSRINLMRKMASKLTCTGFTESLSSIESATDETQETDFSIRHPQVPGTSSSHFGTTGLKLYDLSGRTRETSKQYFEEDRIFNLPQGNPTVAFAEAQLYHILRVLTNETVSMSYNTMERMVISTVKGTPATSKSRTEQLFKRARTPFPTHSSGTSPEVTATPINYDSYTEGDTSAGDETGDSTFHEGTDSAVEMALIKQTFVRPTTS